MSEVAKDFIDKLIRKNPTERIKANEALQHPFLDIKEDDNWYLNVAFFPLTSRHSSCSPPFTHAICVGIMKNKNVEDGIWTRALSE